MSSCFSTKVHPSIKAQTAPLKLSSSFCLVGYRSPWKSFWRLIFYPHTCQRSLKWDDNPSRQTGTKWRHLRLPRQKCRIALTPGKGASLVYHNLLMIRRAHLSLRAAAFHARTCFVLRQVSFHPGSHVWFGSSARPWKEMQTAVGGSKVYKDWQKTAKLFPNLHCSLEVPNPHIISQLLLLILVAI